MTYMKPSHLGGMQRTSAISPCLGGIVRHQSIRPDFKRLTLESKPIRYTDFRIRKLIGPTGYVCNRQEKARDLRCVVPTAARFRTLINVCRDRPTSLKKERMFHLLQGPLVKQERK